MGEVRQERGLSGVMVSLAAGGPTDEHVAKYNQVVKPPVPRTKDTLLVRGMYLMNDLPMVDSPGWVRGFDAAAVRQGVPLIVNKPLMASHTIEVGKGLDGLPQGRYFDSWADGGPEGSPAGSLWMGCLFGIPNDELGRMLVGRIDAGTISESSPTVFYDRIYCNICNADDLDCAHVPGKQYGNRICRAMMTSLKTIEEGSMVWSGRQTGTSYFLAAGKDVKDVPESVISLAKIRELREKAAATTPWQRLMGRGRKTAA